MGAAGFSSGLFAAVASALAGVAEPGAASTPSLTWRDVRAVAVHCNVQDERTGYDAALTRRLCDKVRALASRGSPVPLRVAGLGDRALAAADVVTLVVQGSTTGTGAAKTLLFTIRPHRALPDQPAELFGSAPRATPLATPDSAIEQALTEVLPWRARELGARPIPPSAEIPTEK